MQLNFSELTTEQYHAHEALSSGQIKSLAKSSALWDWERKHPKKPTSSMDFGTAVHMALLEPEKFERNVFFGELPRRGTKKWDDFEFSLRAEKGLLPEDEILFLDNEDAEKIEAIKKNYFDAVRNSGGKFPDILGGEGVNEKSFFAEFSFEEHVIHGRALIDRVWLAKQDPWLIDAKTTRSELDKRSIEYAFVDYGYHIQAQWYRRMFAYANKLDVLPNFAFLFVQNVAPFQVAIVVLSDESERFAEQEITQALRNYVEFNQVGAQLRAPEILEIEVPKWHRENRGYFL